MPHQFSPIFVAQPVGWVEPLRNPSCFVAYGESDGLRWRSTHPTSWLRYSAVQQRCHSVAVDDAGVRPNLIAVHFGQFCGDTRSGDDLLRQRNAHCDFDHAAEHIGVLRCGSEKLGGERVGCGHRHPLFQAFISAIRARSAAIWLR